MYGAGGHAKVVKEIAEALGIEVRGVIDDDKEKEVFEGCRVYHQAQGLKPIVICIGSNEGRERVAACLEEGSIGEALIYPTADISARAEIGAGTVVMAGVVINSGARIGRHCIVNTGATIDHECVIEDFCHISPGVNLCGNVHVGRGSHIGVGASVIPGIRIGRNVTVGAGAAVVRDIPDNVVAAGVPTKIIKHKK